MTIVDASSIGARAPYGLSPRRGQVFDVEDILRDLRETPSPETLAAFDELELVYRTLCGVMFNFVPTSGHPGGSISSGRIVLSLIYRTLDYDFSDPDLDCADRLIYAAGHKALGLYAAWALRDELLRIAAPDLLPAEKRRLRLEDLLGFRRNPTQETPLFKQFRAKPLDGHPTPLMPYVPLATGASGVGVTSGTGYALGLLDHYGAAKAPRVHLIEGEGGMTPGRVQEALAAAATMGLSNLVLHVDWNQASIDSNHVCREDGAAGDYVQWDPAELGLLHDWNVVRVRCGLSFPDILAAQAFTKRPISGQPTMIVYRTVKGYNYGIEGRGSHGAGHKFCSDAYYKHVVIPFETRFGAAFPRLGEKADPAAAEANYWETLLAIRGVLERNERLRTLAAEATRAAADRVRALGRAPRAKGPRLEALYEGAPLDPARPPEALRLAPGTTVTLRAALGTAVRELNRLTGGAFFGAAADLLDSTSVSELAKDFPAGFFHAERNPHSRLLSIGGICEDAIGGVMTGLAAAGHHMGVASSYGAFIAALQHVAARLHCIGQQNQRLATGKPWRAYIMVNGHAGIKTGEDGPTHADPQPLQLLEENFPRGMLVTLTPWDPLEVWPLLVAALAKRPAVIAPFVTRPNEKVPDRFAQGLPGPEAAVSGVYRLVAAEAGRPRQGTVVLQGSEVGMAFVAEVLPRMREERLNLDVFYVASAELFDLLPDEEKARIYPESSAREAMGVTGFTLPTLYRWVTSERGRAASLHPFKHGGYLSSGQAHKVLEEAAMHGEGIWRAVRAYAAR